MKLFSRQGILPLNSMADLLPKLCKGCLVIFDLDDTLHRSKSIEGSELFLDKHTKALMAKGLGEEEAFLEANRHYNACHNAEPSSHAVDPELDWNSVVNDWQEKNIRVIGLTARDPAIAETTLKQMQSIGMSFSTDVVCNQTMVIEGRAVVAHQGVILTNETAKGKTLTHFMPNFRRQLDEFAAIHFVDDKLSNCQSMQQFFCEHQLQGTTYHYPKVKIQGYYRDDEVENRVSQLLRQPQNPFTK